MQDFMSDIYSTFDSQLAENNYQLQNLLMETMHFLSMNLQPIVMSSNPLPNSRQKPTSTCLAPSKSLLLTPEGKETRSSSHTASPLGVTLGYNTLCMEILMLEVPRGHGFVIVTNIPDIWSSRGSKSRVCYSYFWEINQTHGSKCDKPNKGITWGGQASKKKYTGGMGIPSLTWWRSSTSLSKKVLLLNTKRNLRSCSLSY